MRTLLVDDMRSADVTKTCRDFRTACTSAFQEKYDVLYLDHDLGEEKTGYDFIKYCIALDITFKNVIVVSSNPVGRDNIGFALKGAGYRQVTPINFELIQK